MARKFYKECRRHCGGYPACPACDGTGKVRDYELETEYVEYCSDRDRDERMERERA